MIRSTARATLLRSARRRRTLLPAVATGHPAAATTCPAAHTPTVGIAVAHWKATTRSFTSPAVGALSSPAANPTSTAAAATGAASPGGGTIAPGTRVVEIPHPLLLSQGDVLPSFTINYFDSAFFDAQAHGKPIVYIMPSMSHSALVTRTTEQRRAAATADDEEKKHKKKKRPHAEERSRSVSKNGTAGDPQPKGWWEDIVGHGDHFGINLERFRVISASPLGGPYGTTSPLSLDPRTNRAYRASFPLITPLDQAHVHATLLDHLGIAKVHAVVGASMGGMQVLQFAVHYPSRYSRVIAICTTGQTSSSTQALRCVQRAAVRMDPAWQGGDYADGPTSSEGASAVGPIAGMSIARMFGTICYRSREEFDARFSNKLLKQTSRHAMEASAHANHPAQATAASPSSPATAAAGATPPSSTSSVPDVLFDVERYLFHAASSFTGRYDANCYLTLSACMDLQDLAWEPPAIRPPFAEGASSSRARARTPHVGHSLSYEHACALIPHEKQFLLLPIASDALIPPAEMERLASVLGSQGKRVHVERIHSVFGHDAFLKEEQTFNPRFAAFLDTDTHDGVNRVRHYVNSLFDL